NMILECFEVSGGDAELEIVLNYQNRQRSRFRGATVCGKDIAWFIERGRVLAEGDVLVAKSGERVKILAAAETVSIVQCDDKLLLTRAAYHLGNRHVPLQISAGELRYQHDHVLDDML